MKIVLLTRGVFIRYKGYAAGKATADSLAEVVADEEEHQWSNEEIKDIKRQYSPILSYRINKKIASDRRLAQSSTLDPTLLSTDTPTAVSALLPSLPLPVTIAAPHLLPSSSPPLSLAIPLVDSSLLPLSLALIKPTIRQGNGYRREITNIAQLYTKDL